MYRRPVSQRVYDRGICYRILDSISKLSVITNALIIAFTSNFIPHLVYRIVVSKDHSLKGFLEISLSKLDTSDDPQNYQNKIICRYSDYREPWNSNKKYEYTDLFWHILAARLAFVVVFENIVAVVIIIVKWCIPDMSPKLRDKIRREAYITNEIIIQQEEQQVCKLPNNEVKVNEANFIREDIAKLENVGQWNRVMQNSLSAFDFDLEVHGTPMIPPKIGPIEI